MILASIAKLKYYGFSFRVNQNELKFVDSQYNSCDQIQLLFRMMEPDESVQFYQVKLMEKDRELSELHARLKKLQFKHSRDIKELKIAEERAKQLLKDEKAKLDRIAKQALQHQEQNALLTRRLTQLKTDKDRETDAVRSQYNQIKEEVRSYQRILPTHAFLVQIATGIYQLPTYEELYITLRETNSQRQALQTQLNALRLKSQQQRKQWQSNEEGSRLRLLEMQKQVKSVVAKWQETDGEVGVLKQSLRESEEKEEQLELQIKQLQQQLGALQSYNQELKEREEELQRKHLEDLEEKEEEIRVVTTEEYERYEAEIGLLKRAFLEKEEGFCRHVGLLEQENAQLHRQIQEDKEKHEEDYHEINEVITTLKNKTEEDKSQKQDLQQAQIEAQSNLQCATQENNSLREHIASLQHQLASLAKDLAQKDAHFETMSLQTQISSLEAEAIHTNEAIEKQAAEIKRLSESNFQLSNELQEIRLMHLSGESISSELEGMISRSSRDFDKTEGKLKEEENRKIQLQAENEEMRVETEELKEELSLLRKTYGQTLQNERRLEQKLAAKNTQVNTLVEGERSKAKDILTRLEIMQSEANELKTQLDKKEVSAALEASRYALVKTDLELLQGEKSRLEAELVREKELARTLKTQLKNVKDTYSGAAEEWAKKQKDAQAQSTLLKQEKQKLLSQSIAREKTYVHEISLLRVENSACKDKAVLLEHRVESMRLEEQDNSRKLKELKEQLRLESEYRRQAEEERLSKAREAELLGQALQRQRKERTLISVPSLQAIHADIEVAADQNFQSQYNRVGQKEGQIYAMQRQIADLKENIEHERIRQHAFRESMEAQSTEYIQQIIRLKLRVAESQMKASEKEYLYLQLRKRMT